MRLLRTILLGTVCLFFLTANPDVGFARQDQDEAQRARKQGELMPYGQITRLAEKEFGGRVVGQKIRKTGPETWVYELRILKQDGRVLIVFMDAKTGTVISTKGR